MKRPAWIPFAPAALLTAGNGLTATLAAAFLDLLIVRPRPATPGSGSISTLLPGLAYAGATVMKVCLVAGLLAALAALCHLMIRLLLPIAREPALKPRCALASIALAPLSTLAGALSAVVFQRLALTRAPVSVAQFQQVAPAAVYVMLAVLTLGVVFAGTSWLRREGATWTPALGLALNALLIALFLYLRFFAPAFDQDAWAPRAF